MEAFSLSTPLLPYRQQLSLTSFCNYCQMNPSIRDLHDALSLSTLSSCLSKRIIMRLLCSALICARLPVCLQSSRFAVPRPCTLSCSRRPQTRAHAPIVYAAAACKNARGFAHEIARPYKVYALAAVCCTASPFARSLSSRKTRAQSLRRSHTHAYIYIYTKLAFFIVITPVHKPRAATHTERKLG